MSEEQAVRGIYEAWNALDLGLKYFDAEFELHQTATLLDSARVFRGHDGVLEASRELFGGLRDLSWEPEDFISVADGRIVVPFRFRGVVARMFPWSCIWSTSGLCKTGSPSDATPTNTYKMPSRPWGCGWGPSERRLRTSSSVNQPRETTAAALGATAARSPTCLAGCSFSIEAQL